MRASAHGIDLIAAFEGFRSRPYRDAVGVWTVGFGETHGVGPDTSPVTRAQALRQLHRRVDRDYAPGVGRLVKVPLSQRQFDALVSFAYNLGTGALGSSTLLRELNQRHYARAANEFLKWDRAGGRRLEGLSRRRRAERRMFLRGSNLRTRLRAAALRRLR